MYYLLLLAIILLLVGILWYFHIPQELTASAKKAEIGKFSVTYSKLKRQKLPAKFLFDLYAAAKQVKIHLKFDELIEYHKTYPEKTENLINAMIRAKRSGIDFKISEIEIFEKAKGNIEDLVNALKIVNNANIKIDRDVLETHSLYGGDIETFVEILLRAQKAHLDLDLRQLVEENLNDEDMRKIVNTLIRIKKADLFIAPEEAKKLIDIPDTSHADLRISQKSILEHFRTNIDIEKYANAMIKAQKAGLEIDRRALNIHYLTDGDVEKLVNTMIKAEKAGIYLSQAELVENNLEGKDVGKIVKNIIRAKQAELDLTPNELIEFHRIGGETDKFVTSLIIAQKANLGIGKKELEEHHLAGADVLEYVKSRKLISDLLPDISADELNSHYLKGGNMLKTILAVMYARKNNVAISASTAFTYDLTPNFDITEIVKWAVNPVVMQVEPIIHIVVKDGILVSPKISVTLRGKIELYTNGSRESVLFGRINEAVSEELTKYDTHSDVLKNLNSIAISVFEKLTGERREISKTGLNKFETEDELKKINKTEQKLNESNALEILDLRITEINIGEDTLADYKIQQAKHDREIAKIESEEHAIKHHAQEVQARIRLIEAKAKVHEGMAEAMKNSKSSPEIFDKLYSKYQTEKNIFENLEDESFPKTEH